MDTNTPVISGQDTVNQTGIEESIEEETTIVGDEVVQGEKKEGGIPHDAQEAINKRIDELTRKRYEAERDAAYWKGMAEASKKIEAPKETKPSAENVKPVLDDFSTYNEYVDSLSQYNAGLKIQEEKKKEKKEKDDQAKKEKLIELGKKATAIIELGRKKYADYDIVVNPYVPLTNDVVEMIISSENPEDIAYYISKDIKLANHLASLPALKIGAEIAKIDAQFTSKNKTSGLTTAPKPIQTLDSFSGSTEPAMEDMDIDTWMKRWGK